MIEEISDDKSELSLSPFDQVPSVLVHETPRDLSEVGTFTIAKYLPIKNKIPNNTFSN